MVVIPAEAGMTETMGTGLTHLGDFHHKMRKTGRHCASSQTTKQSMFIITLRSSGLLPAAFRAVAMMIRLL
jgi:hypothetical protein